MNHAAALIAVMAVCTVLLRALPFLLMPDSRETPEFILFLGSYLPPAMIAMLVVYCLKDMDFSAAGHGVPEFLSVISVMILQKWKHNSLVSIGGGTILYMILIRILL
ncbi:MAG: AzlD domain-containing protein [Erysipelotrichaceae bacterium]|nr:AzlD domain-containing protein [Erysipelotrichaceae bacterium]